MTSGPDLYQRLSLSSQSTGKYGVLLAHTATVFGTVTPPRRSTEMSAAAARRALTVGGGGVAKMAVAAAQRRRRTGLLTVTGATAVSLW